MVHSITCSHKKVVYNPKTFIPHAVSLRQAFAHCGRFSTAASRRSMGRISVPFLGVALSRPLPVIDLVGRYPANYLMGRRPFTERIAPLPLRDYWVLSLLSQGYAHLGGMYLRVTKPFAAIAHASLCSALTDKFSLITNYCENEFSLITNYIREN